MVIEVERWKEGCWKQDNLVKSISQYIVVSNNFLTMSLTSSFNAYKSEFISTTEQIKSTIQSKHLDQIEYMLTQGDDLIKQMSLEARGVDDASVKRDLLSQVRLHDCYL